MSDDSARTAPKRAKQSALDNWAKSKSEHPEQWLKDWNDAKEWIKSLTKIEPKR